MANENQTAAEKRSAVVRKYEEILGRNKYSQAKRGYAFKKYSDGKYYSDCSSSIALAYKYAGYPFCDNSGNSNPNTVGMYKAESLKPVPVEIRNGVIRNPEVLRIGDMLLFAGSDTSRKYAGFVGHVEMVGRIEGSRITLYGHGSGTPRATEMNAYCKKRYSGKTSTELGHKGLIRVVRFFTDAAETEAPEGGGILITGGSVNLRTGPGTRFPDAGTARRGQRFASVQPEGWLPVESGGRVLWVSGKYARQEDSP